MMFQRKAKQAFPMLNIILLATVAAICVYFLLKHFQNTAEQVTQEPVEYR
jgi:lipopolysaccharide export system protein LptC